VSLTPNQRTGVLGDGAEPESIARNSLPRLPRRRLRCAAGWGGVGQCRGDAPPQCRSVADTCSMGKGKRKKNDDDDAEVNYINDRNKKFNQKVSGVFHANPLYDLYSGGLTIGSRDCWTAADKRYRRLGSTTSSRVLSERTSSEVRLCRGRGADGWVGCVAYRGGTCITVSHGPHVREQYHASDKTSGVFSWESPGSRLAGQETLLIMRCLLLVGVLEEKLCDASACSRRWLRR
jgi:hypothetical protein